MKFLKGCLFIAVFTAGVFCALLIEEVKIAIEHMRGIKHTVEDFADIADIIDMGKGMKETIDILQGKEPPCNDQ